MVHVPSGHRTVAFVGPYGSGKSTLFEAMLAAAGSPRRRGLERSGSDLHLAGCTFMDEPWTLIDCPGSVEFAHAAASAVAVADLAVLVCDPAPARAPTVAPWLHLLETSDVPTIVFVNRIDTLAGRIRDTIAALQDIARRPLVLRQVPMRDGETITGYVDVVSERAYRYRDGGPSDLVSIPAHMRDREQEARGGLVEVLADHDDALLEKLVEDIAPSTGEIYDRLRQDQRDGVVASCLLGAAEAGWGVRRLWKALRHDTPSAPRRRRASRWPSRAARSCRCSAPSMPAMAASCPGPRLARPVKDGASLDGARIGGIWRAAGGDPVKVTEAATGEIVALGRLEGVATGAVIGDAGDAVLPFPETPEPVYALAIATADRKDDVSSRPRCAS